MLKVIFNLIVLSICMVPDSKASFEEVSSEKGTLLAAHINEYRMVEANYQKYQQDLETMLIDNLTQNVELREKPWLEVQVMRGSQYIAANKEKYLGLIDLLNNINREQCYRNQLIVELSHHQQNFGNNCRGASTLCRKNPDTCTVSDAENRLINIENSILNSLEGMNVIILHWFKCPA
jgi:hypothetical protein